ncbi:MAG: tetratricopeptide repeat protein [Kiritimatiellae bacterium]|nr:tetratricopeptide repeat protein [Kiritimatiellia bacterium]MDD4341793.1 tetratricopeptide repeat protein [Kiritimatiellia bacterium]
MKARKRVLARAWKWGACLAVAAAPWLGGLNQPFLYDDIGMIAENDFLADASNWTQVISGRTLADPQVVNGRRPVVLATFFLDRAVHGLQPAGWRLTSLLLHLGCVGVWMGLLRRLGVGEFVTLAAGLLFALHPAGVEVVHAPGFRADLLCLLFMLAALHSVVSMRHHGGLGLIGCGVCAALALLSKETALVLPLLVGALMVLFPAAFPASGIRRVAGLGVCALVAVGFFVLWMLLPTDMQALGGSWNGESLQFPETVWSIPALWGRTVRFLLVPWPLNVTPYFEPVASIGSGRFWGWGLFLAACLVGVWRLHRSTPWLAFGVAWIVLLFLPVSNLLPLLHPVADRYLYPMAPGLAVALAWGIARVPRLARPWLLAGLAVLLAGLVMVRIGEWESGERLWRTAYSRNPRSGTAATWMGLLHDEAGDPVGAREWYARAVEANPYEVAAWINWGVLEGKRGQWAESERLLRQAMAVRPESASARANLATCLAGQGRFADAAALREAQGRPKP